MNAFARRTKIVATIGPATASPERLAELLEAGMDAARLNLSHGDHDFHREAFARLRKAAAQAGKPLAIIFDTRGPEVRTRNKEAVQVHSGERFLLAFTQGEPAEGRIAVDHDLTRDLERGDLLLIGDEVELEVEEVLPRERAVRCKALNQGLLRPGRRVAVLNKTWSLPFLTARDEADLRLAAELGADYIAVSFVREAADLARVREVVQDKEIKLIAKVETRPAVENIQEILEAADGLMVARGDLGTALRLEELPLVQKRLIRLANRAGKPVITATQMLRSMVREPRPTRAEVTDVANAVLDGTDALMLSEETAIGAYPVEAVATMARIAAEAERDYPFLRGLEDQPDHTESVAAALGRAACELARDLDAVIITSTRSGSTARLIAKFRPAAPLIAVTPSERVRNQLALVWGVQPLLMPFSEETDKMIALALTTAQEHGLVTKERAVITAGVPFGIPGITNLIKVEEV